MPKLSNSLNISISYLLMGVVRLVLALTFLFSGIVELIDPRGT